jgi:hypothetical protein
LGGFQRKPWEESACGEKKAPAARKKRLRREKSACGEKKWPAPIVDWRDDHFWTRINERFGQGLDPMGAAIVSKRGHPGVVFFA